MELNTKHIHIKSVYDPNHKATIDGDELESIFYFIISRTARKVCTADIKTAFTTALHQLT